ncbi:hypothetical protein ACXNAL_18610 [Kluyvera ascorbata]
MNNQYRSKHDIHPLDPYIKWLANRKIMLSAWVITILVGMWLSHHFNQWSLLPRFGCIGIMLGTLLTLSPLFSDGIYLSNAEAFGFGNVDEDGKTAVTSDEGRKVSVNILWGVILIVISSVINAFGDLIGGSVGSQGGGSGFWSALGALGSVGAAVAAAVAAGLSWRVGINSAKNQNESLNELKKRNQLDMLTMHATRANEAIRGARSEDWQFVQFQNVMRAIRSAILDVQMLPDEGFLSKSVARAHFRNCLDVQILTAVQKRKIPSAAHQQSGSYMEAQDNENMWKSSTEFLCD